jgi:hypothetical protein
MRIGYIRPFFKGWEHAVECAVGQSVPAGAVSEGSEGHWHHPLRRGFATGASNRML